MTRACPSSTEAGPLLLSPAQDRELQKLGYRLSLFQRAANELYHQSLEGKQPAWVAQWLERGRPHPERTRGPLAEIIQPEIALTPAGFRLVELSYAAHDWALAARLSAECAAAGFDVVGGPEGMRGEPPAPAGAHLSQRMWLALFWLRPLHGFWRRELSDRQFAALQKVMPPAWLIDAATLPPHAVVPWLEVNAWDEVARFGPERRAGLMLRPSRPESEELAIAGGLVGASEWREAIHRAIAEAGWEPWILQQTGPAKTRLWPCYLVREGKSELRGVLVRSRLSPRETRVTVAAVRP